MPKNFKVKLLMSYDGSAHGGWQRQPTNPETVQGRLERALSQILDEPIRVIGSGRTDAGVHALAQVAHFATSKDPQKFRIAHALQRLLGPTIVVRKAWLAPQEFHAQRSAMSKTYKYLVLHRRYPSAIHHGLLHWVPIAKDGRLSIETLNSYARVFVGTHDFSAFQNVGTTLKSSIRSIFRCEWKDLGRGLLTFEIKGSGFLKQMVRNLVGIQLHAASRDWPAGEIEAIMQAKSKIHTVAVAPAQGLYLKSVDYPPELDKGCVQL